jgi:hypothetical protein
MLGVDRVSSQTAKAAAGKIWETRAEEMAEHKDEPIVRLGCT